MARKSFHDLMERTAFPILIIILIPLAAVLYLLFGTGSAQPAATPSTLTTANETSSVPVTPPPANMSIDDPQSLPQQVSAAQLVPFSFSIQNPSDQNATYQYKVSVHWSTGEEDVIDENTFSLAGGASTTIPEELKFEIATETAEVSVQLPQTGQSIEFMLPRAQ